MKTSIRNKLTQLMLVSTLLMAPVVAMAQQLSSAPSAAQVAQNGTNTLNSFSIMIQAAVCLVGFIICCSGIYGFYRVTKEKGQGQHSIGASLAGCVVGVLMIMLPLTVGSLGKSLFGDQMSQPQRIQITPQ